MLDGEFRGSRNSFDNQLGPDIKNSGSPLRCFCQPSRTPNRSVTNGPVVSYLNPPLRLFPSPLFLEQPINRLRPINYSRRLMRSRHGQIPTGSLIITSVTIRCDLFQVCFFGFPVPTHIFSGTS